MAPASLVMNPSGPGTRGGDRAGSGPLPFGVEALLEAQREPREERPGGAAQPRGWFPPPARSSSPRKCPVARSWATTEPGPARRTKAGGALSLLTWKSN